MKKEIRQILLLILLFAGLSAKAYAASDYVTYESPPVAGPVHVQRGTAQNGSSDWNYAVLGDGVVLYSYYGKDRSVTVPGTLDGRPVIALSGTFSENHDLVSVTLPSSLKYIGESSFYMCTALNSVQIARGVESIGNYAFYGCESLADLKLPDTLSSIGYMSFYNCGNLMQLDIPDTVESINRYSFDYGLILVVGEGSYAQMFAAEIGFMCYTRCGVDLTVEIDPNDYNIYNKASVIVSTLVKPEMSEYQKALILHDYLILHASYDQTYSRYSAADILLYHSGVCQAYTEAYELLLRFAGIQCIQEFGYDHVWNMAKLDGEWVHIDCTWDDPITGSARGGERHDFFGITNYALEGIRSHECYNKAIIAESVERSFAYKAGQLSARIEVLPIELQYMLEQGQLHGYASESFYWSYDEQKNGIMNRMLYQAASLEDIRWHGYPAALDTELDAENAEMGFDAYVSVPAKKTMVLPKAMTKLEAGSLNGTAAHRFVLPAGLKSIGAGAFPDGFFVIEAPEGSYALEYAQSAGLPWQFSPKA